MRWVWEQFQEREFHGPGIPAAQWEPPRGKEAGMAPWGGRATGADRPASGGLSADVAAALAESQPPLHAHRGPVAPATHGHVEHQGPVCTWREHPPQPAPKKRGYGRKDPPPPLTCDPELGPPSLDPAQPPRPLGGLPTARPPSCSLAPATCVSCLGPARFGRRGSHPSSGGRCSSGLPVVLAGRPRSLSSCPVSDPWHLSAA